MTANMNTENGKLSWRTRLWHWLSPTAKLLYDMKRMALALDQLQYLAETLEAITDDTPPQICPDCGAHMEAIVDTDGSISFECVEEGCGIKTDDECG